MSVSAQYVLKHYRELMKTPLPNVGVAPLEDDFNEWHVNFFFPDDHQFFPNLVLHFKMVFTSDYPTVSPRVTLYTNMQHSHVHFPAVCFSLLPDYRGYFEATSTPRTAYWNPARTARSFLEDLYTFLLVDDDMHFSISRQDGERALDAAKNFRCTCGHHFNTPQPACPDLIEIAKTRSLQEAEEAHTNTCPLNREEECGHSHAANRRDCDLPASTIEDLRCSITRSLFLDDGVVMGFGVNVERLAGGKLRIDTDLSPLSWEAFNAHKIRTSADGADITHFIPYVINAQHFTPAARHILAQTVASITSDRNLNPTNGLLFVLGEVWKTRAVLLTSGREHASEKALKGFCAIHHLLLASARHMPLVAAATEQVGAFIESPDKATKDKVPDLGQFLTLFLLSKVRWNGPEMAGTAVVREQFARNALWITKQLPGLADPDAHPTDRVDLSWEPSATGLKLTALQIRFMLALPAWAASFRLLHASDTPPPAPADPTRPPTKAPEPEEGWEMVRGARDQASGKERPSGAGARSETGSGEAGWEVLAMYDALGGRPTEDMLVAFQLESKRVQAMTSYQHYFAALALGMPTRPQCHTMLVAAMRRSAQLGYHGRGPPQRGGTGGRGRGRGRW